MDEHRKAFNHSLVSTNLSVSTNARHAIRNQLRKNRQESFKELMKFNLDLELDEAQRSLSQVNATQSFVSKAMRGKLEQRKVFKTEPNQAEPIQSSSPKVSFKTADGLKTSIKSQKVHSTVFKGINITTSEDGKGLKFQDKNKSRKV